MSESAIGEDIRLVCRAADLWISEDGPYLSSRVGGVVVNGPRVDEAVDRLRAFFPATGISECGVEDPASEWECRHYCTLAAGHPGEHHSIYSFPLQGGG